MQLLYVVKWHLSWQEKMGQVSILEDIQKAIENLEHEVARSVPPTEVAIGAQKKRLEKERIRLADLASTLLLLARDLNSGLNEKSMRNVSGILQFQVNQKRLDAIKGELKAHELQWGKAKTIEAKFKSLKLEQDVNAKKISALTEGFHHVGVSREQRKNIIKQVLDQKLSTLVKNHADMKKIRAELASIRSERDQAISELEALRNRYENCKTMLRQQSARVRTD